MLWFICVFSTHCVFYRLAICCILYVYLNQVLHVCIYSELDILFLFLNFHLVQIGLDQSSIHVFR